MLFVLEPAIVPLVCFQVHERLDGSGYPQGCRSERIHLFARILHVADAFPIRNLFDALLAGFEPATGGAVLGQLAVVAAWGLLGFVVALRRFRWEPRP